MPIYSFKCADCGYTSDREMSFDEVQEIVMLPCCCRGADGDGVGRETTHKRIYSFGLAPVKGAGGSPGRFGSVDKDD
jgi:hypothetical protein